MKRRRYNKDNSPTGTEAEILSESQVQKIDFVIRVDNFEDQKTMQAVYQIELTVNNRLPNLWTPA